MRINPRASQSRSRQTNRAGMFSGAANASSLSGPSSAAAFLTPLEALGALEQWRMLEEQALHPSVRWTLEKSPLTVWFEPHPNTAIASGVSTILFQAMRQWEAASQGIIRFVRHHPNGWANEAPPDIVVRWQEETVLGREFEVGHTRRTAKNQRIQQAEITLIINPAIDAHLSPKKQQQRLHATILHETGHALGLEHSNSAQDVMHYRGWQRPYLSEGDSQRIRQLYGSNAKILG